jgi:hypothetical protein
MSQRVRKYSFRRKIQISLTTVADRSSMVFMSQAFNNVILSKSFLDRFVVACGGCHRKSLGASSGRSARRISRAIKPHEETMIAIRLTFGLVQHPAMARAWHLWTVIVPRRTITGRLVRGQVWRRRDGRRWLYKKFGA